jgi:hypothetical protein
VALTPTLDPIPALGALAKQAKESVFWPQDQAARIGERFAQAVAWKLAPEGADWPGLYADVLAAAKESLSDLERQQLAATQEMTSASLQGNAEIKRIEGCFQEADAVTKKLKAEIEKAPQHYLNTGGRLDRQAKQILEAVGEAEREFAVEETRAARTVELRLADAFVAKIAAFVQASLEQWSGQTVRDLPRYVPGEAPHLMEQLDSHAKQANVYPFSFAPAATDPPTASFSLGGVRGRLEIPGLGGQFFRTFRSAIYGVGIFVTPILAVAGLFVASGEKINAGRGLLLAALFPIMGIVTYFWARYQRNQALAEQVAKEGERLRDAYRRAIQDAVAKRREAIGNQVKRYFKDAGRSLSVWSDEFLKRARERCEAQSMQALEQSKARQEEVSQRLVRVRLAVKQLQEYLIPRIEERARDLGG